jgi:hypothetical protein
VFGAGCPRRSHVVASFPFPTSCRPASQRPAYRCRRAIRPVAYVEPRSSIKCSGLQGGGLQVLSPTVACAGWSPTSSSQPPAAQRLLVQLRRCTCGGIIGVPLLRRRPFVQGRTGVQRVAGTKRSAQTCFSRLWGLSYNKSLLRSGGQWYLVCKSLAGIDKVPMISLGEPPAAELSRWAALRHGSQL